ncbi:MAG TPA: WXG100 family type VII secretion target [Aeromicrobium sp.]|nr:WXG100 family type VII secretion target [Aeromicrobium sp.]
MEPSVEVVVSQLHSAAARLADAGQRLHDGLSAVDVEVGQLLGSGWKGGAATAYNTEWEKWHDGAGQVVLGLQTMSELLTVAGKEYAKTDEQNAGAISSSFQGAGGSGGDATGGNPGGQGAGPSSSGQGEGVAGLAQQMDLGQSMMAPVSQIGQAVTGLAQQAGQAAAGVAQAASGLAQQAAAKDDEVTRDESEERDGEAERPSDAAGSGEQSGSTAPVDTAPVETPRPAPQSSTEGGHSSGGSRLSGE